MQRSESIIYKGILQAETIEHIPPSFIMEEVLDDILPDQIMWCGDKISRTDNLQKHNVSFIDCSRLENDAATLFYGLRENSSKAEHEQLCHRMVQIARARDGGAAFLMLLNNSLRCTGIPLSALSDSTHPDAGLADAILESSISSAPAYRRSVCMFHQLPWAASSLKATAQSDHGFELTVVEPAADIVNARWGERNELRQLLNGTSLAVANTPQYAAAQSRA